MKHPGPDLPADADLRGEVESLRREVEALRARLAEALTLADADPLTGLLNHRAFVRELTRTIAFVKRYGGAATLLYFDIDGFKAVNDRLGHAAGDAALRTVADRLTSNVRTTDLVGRLGGDEFAVILTRTGAPAGAVKANALAAAIGDAPIPCGGTEVRVSVTWGYCEIGAASRCDQVLADADAAMYARKAARPQLSRPSTPAG